MGREDRSVESLVKAKAVLSVLQERGVASIKDIAARVCEPVSSTYRLLSSLMALGWVEKAAKRGEYRLGVDCIRIGGRIERRLDIQHIARQCFRAHREQTGVWGLYVLRQFRAVCIEARAYEQVESYAQMVGTFLPLGMGAAARVLGAFLPEHTYERLLDYQMGAAGLGELSSAFRLETISDAAQVRRVGFAYDVGRTTAGALSVAAPVFNHAGDAVAAVSLGGLPRTLERRLCEGDLPEEVSLVMRVSREVSAELGYIGDEEASDGE